MLPKYTWSIEFPKYAAKICYKQIVKVVADIYNNNNDNTSW